MRVRVSLAAAGRGEPAVLQAGGGEGDEEAQRVVGEHEEALVGGLELGLGLGLGLGVGLGLGLGLGSGLGSG